ncbi:hypothetical protein SDC9_53892 [bioreactor metagenome]|uniref:Uncharacterized protein n=1 Tax=bioreactor metagenome TaxID=1076179 RepID=A0A644WUI9_9ZZZZ
MAVEEKVHDMDRGVEIGKLYLSFLPLHGFPVHLHRQRRGNAEILPDFHGVAPDGAVRLLDEKKFAVDPPLAELVGKHPVPRERLSRFLFAGHHEFPRLVVVNKPPDNLRRGPGAASDIHVRSFHKPRLRPFVIFGRCGGEEGNSRENHKDCRGDPGRSFHDSVLLSAGSFPAPFPPVLFPRRAHFHLDRTSVGDEPEAVDLFHVDHPGIVRAAAPQVELQPLGVTFHRPFDHQFVVVRVHGVSVFRYGSPGVAPEDMGGLRALHPVGEEFHGGPSVPVGPFVHGEGEHFPPFRPGGPVHVGKDAVEKKLRRSFRSGSLLPVARLELEGRSGESPFALHGPGRGQEKDRQAADPAQISFHLRIPPFRDRRQNATIPCRLRLRRLRRRIPGRPFRCLPGRKRTRTSPLMRAGCSSPPTTGRCVRELPQTVR